MFGGSWGDPPTRDTPATCDDVEIVMIDGTWQLPPRGHLPADRRTTLPMRVWFCQPATDEGLDGDLSVGCKASWVERSFRIGAEVDQAPERKPRPSS